MNTNTPQKIIVGVFGLPIRKDKKIYLTRRHAPGRTPWHNKWQIPGGGLEFGEKPIKTLKREMMEELQVTVDVIHPQPIVKTSIWYGHEVEQKQDTQIILITYVVDIKNQTPNFDKDEETNHGGWFDHHQINSLSSLPMSKEIIDDAIKMCNKYTLWDMLQ